MARLFIISNNWSMNCSCFWGHSQPWQGKPHTFATRPRSGLDNCSRCPILCCPCCGQWQATWPDSSSFLSLTLAGSLLIWLSNSILRLLPQSAPSEVTFQAAMTPGSTLQMQNAKCCQNILQCEFVTQPEGEASLNGGWHAAGPTKAEQSSQGSDDGLFHRDTSKQTPQSIPSGHDRQRPTSTA